VLAWPQVAGPTLAQHASPLRVRSGRLELAVPAATWRAQLVFLQQDLVARLNAAAGCHVISSLVLVNRPL